MILLQRTINKILKKHGYMARTVEAKFATFLLTMSGGGSDITLAGVCGGGGGGGGGGGNGGSSV